MTKNCIFSLLVCLIPIISSAQSPPKKISISAAYWGYYAIYPGAKIGLSIPLKDWQIKKDKKGAIQTNNIRLFVQPELAFYNNANFYTSLFANVDIGTIFQKQDRKFYSALSIGLGYLAQFDITSTTVNFKGEIIKENRSRTDYFAPTINCQFGHDITPIIGWYSKISLGAKISAQREGAPILFLELGLKFSFNANKTNN